MSAVSAPASALYDALSMVGIESDTTALEAILRALEEVDNGCDDERTTAIQAASWRLHRRIEADLNQVYYIPQNRK